MQQVTELMENRFHFAVDQQRRLATRRRSKVAADQSQVWAKAGSRRPAGDQRFHPGAAALILAGIPVSVEAAEKLAGFVVNVVVANLGVPNGYAALFGDFHAVEPTYQLEQAGRHALQGKVRPQGFLIEVV